MLIASLLRTAERCLLAIGLLSLTLYGVARLHGAMGSRAAVASYGAADSEIAAEEGSRVDFALWAEGRIQAHEESLGLDPGETLAVLVIPTIGLEVPVFDGTSELVLNLGVGRIAGTARPGETGNIGLAGHRDGFFRALKEIAVGDAIELRTRGRSESFIVESTAIVEPSEVSVLAPTNDPTLTLVTCYPFYFVGNAPQRFIVRATLRPPTGKGSPSVGEK